MTDLGGAAERGDAAAAIEFQLHAGMRHVVPVNRQAGAGEIRRAGDADAAAERQLAKRVAPVGGAGHAPQALGEADGADAQVVRRQRVGLLDDAQAQFGGIEGQRLGDLVELNLLTETALRRAMSALRTAGRFVGEHAASFEVIRRDVIRHGLQRAGVERARDAVRSVGAAVEQRFHVHAGDRAVVLHAGLERHQHRMPSAVAVEDLLAGQADLHRPVEHQRRFGDDHLVVERIALAAEAAAVRRRDDADVRRRHRQRPGECAMHVVRRLRARPQHQLAVGILGRHRRVLFDRQVRVALIEERVFEHAVGVGKRLRDVAEPERHRLVNIPAVAVVVDARLGIGEALLGLRVGAQRFVGDADVVERLEGGEFITGNHRGDRIADEAHAIDRQRVLVLADRQDAVADRKIGAGQHQIDAGPRQCAAIRRAM